MPKEANQHVLDAERLRQISGKRSAAGVRRWAQAQGIRIKESTHGPWTTLEALNESLGLRRSNPLTYSPEDVL
jgi:hypothetical protein